MRTKRYDGEDGSDVNLDQEMGQKYSSQAEDMSPEVTAKAAPAPKKKVVTKEELEKSGLSLRDYMNKQEGKVRREPKDWEKRGFTGSETGGDAAIMYRKKMATGGKAFAKGGSIKEARMEPSKMERGGDLKKGNLPRGEHAIQQKGHTRALMPKMAGNDIGTQSPKRK